MRCLLFVGCWRFFWCSMALWVCTMKPLSDAMQNVVDDLQDGWYLQIRYWNDQIESVWYWRNGGEVAQIHLSTYKALERRGLLKRVDYFIGTTPKDLYTLSEASNVD